MTAKQKQGTGKPPGTGVAAILTGPAIVKSGTKYDKASYCKAILELEAQASEAERAADAMWLTKKWPYVRAIAKALQTLNPATGKTITGIELAGDLGHTCKRDGHGRKAVVDSSRVSRAKSAYHKMTDPNGEYKWTDNLSQLKRKINSSEITAMRSILNNSRGAAKQAGLNTAQAVVQFTPRQGTGLIQRAERVGAQGYDYGALSTKAPSLAELVDAVNRGWTAQSSKTAAATLPASTAAARNATQPPSTTPAPQSVVIEGGRQVEALASVAYSFDQVVIA